MKQLGEMLKSMREKAGLSQRDVASKMGYTTPQSISNVERSSSYLPIKDLKKISELYNTDTNYLFECVRDAKIVKMREKIK